MKFMDKLLDNIKFEKKYVLFSLVIVILGILTGSLFIVILDKTDKNIVIEYIFSFVENIKNNNINNFDLLKNILLNNYIIIIIFTIIGFSFFFFPINILILFYKSFVIGFTLSSFVITYSLKGLLLSIIYIFPHLIINILLFSLITAFTTQNSINMIKYIIKKQNINMRYYFNKYFSILFIIFIILLITGLYESYIMPNLIKLIVNI